MRIRQNFLLIAVVGDDITVCVFNVRFDIVSLSSVSDQAYCIYPVVSSCCLLLSVVTETLPTSYLPLGDETAECSNKLRDPIQQSGRFPPEMQHIDHSFQIPST